MSSKKGGLGRGFDSLFSDNALESDSSLAPVQVNIVDIEPNKDQARKEFDDEKLRELASSIEQHGVLQPLLVKSVPGGGYRLIAGERRWRASRLAGLTKVPVIVRDLTDEEVAVISLIENLQREDLNIVEQAAGLSSLAEEFGMTHEEIAQKVGKSRANVTNTLRVMNLPEETLGYLRQNLLSFGHAKVLLAIKDEKLLNETALKVIEGGWSVRATENYVKKLLKEPKIDNKPARSRRDSFFDEVEISLLEECGLKTKVDVDKKGESGSITVEFDSKDRLKDIASALNSIRK
ncbi:MAG: ParB/RepB/Spo0J family partition protein [Clostridiales bacterium]|nr:ParB/RepB/Spo0J family partition protein [Clostridiales bacterium]